MKLRLFAFIAFAGIASSTGFADSVKWKFVGPNAPFVLQLTPDRRLPGVWYALTYPMGYGRPPERLALLYRTSDSGLTWTRAQLSNVMYATVHYPTSTLYTITSPKKNTSELWTSMDQGRTFRIRAEAHFSLRKVFPHPSKPSILYGFGLSQTDLAYSKDAGNSWTAINNFPFHLGQSFGEADCKATSYQLDNLLFDSSNKIFLSGTILLTRQCTSMDCEPDCGDAAFLLVSKDNAKTWRKLSFDRGIYTLYQEPQFPDLIYASGWGGFFTVTSDGLHLLSKSFLSDVGIYPNNPKHLVAIKSNFLEMQTTNDGGVTWRTFAPTFQGALKIVRTTGDSRDGFFATAANAGILYRNDSGKWTPRNAGIPESSVIAVAASQSKPTVVYAITGEGYGDFLFRTNDLGKNWENISLNMPDDPDAFRLYRIIVDPSDSAHVIAESRLVYETRNAGKSWRKIFPSGIQNAVFDPFNSKIVYYTRGFYLYRSTEGGDRPQPFSIRLPESYFDIVLDPNVPQLLYLLGGDGRLFKSTDGGRTVQQIDRNRRLELYDLKILGPQSTLIGFSYPQGTVRSTDHGEHWQRISALFADTLVGIDGSADHLLSTAGQFYGSFQIHESFDGGRHWIDITPQFPKALSTARYAPAYSAYDSIFTPMLVATGRGLFMKN